MKVFAFLEPFFNALSDGKLIRLVVAWVLRVVAVLMALVGLFAFIAILGVGFKTTEDAGPRSVSFLIGCVLASLFCLAWGYLMCAVFFFRARSIAELGDSHFTVLSILSLLFRLNGEMALVTYSLLGVGGCLFAWFTESSLLEHLGALSGSLPFAGNSSGGFLGGLTFAGFMLLIGFASIVLFYALAELTVVLVEIALNTRSLRPVPARPVPVRTPAPAPQPVVSAHRVCHVCAQPLESSATFCGECGTPVR